MSGAARLLGLIRSRGASGLTRAEFLAYRFARDSADADLAELVSRGLVLPCYRHGGTEAGPPELVYHVRTS